MFQRKLIALGVLLALGLPSPSRAASDTELQQLRREIQLMKQAYEARIDALERRINLAENQADKAWERAETVAAAPVPAQGENAFNPGISLILSGTYANLSQDPAGYAISGFVPSGGEVGPGERGFSLKESELVVSANIDPNWRGNFTLAVAPDNTVAVEEAYVQSLALGNGLTAKGGRFFSGVGYLNEQHPHSWDFVDAPLAYQAFFGNQLGEDGVQLKWLAPTDTYLEIGAELARGRSFPGSDRNKNGTGLSTLFAHLGGDVGASHAWRAGLSLVRTSPRDRAYDDMDSTGTAVTNAFSGDSKMWLADFVWKWAPQGNSKSTNLTLQGEYFRRTEDGSLTYDTAAASLGTATGAYASAQSGWYVQGVYQFMPHWRAGLRYDRLNGGSTGIGLVNSGALTAADFPLLGAYDPRKASLMVDYSPSEFSRLRFQLARDQSRQGLTDNQLFLQYIMSLGAHGAHKF